MADDITDPHATHEGDDYISEKARRYQRFIELGGDVTIDQDLRALGRKPELIDYVTPRHRDLVMDLAAANVSHDGIAKMLGIAKSTLQELFELELAIGFDVKQAGLSRALYTSGMSGDTQAAIGWLRHNPQSKWASKAELSEKGAEQQSEALQAQNKLNQDWARAMVSGMLTDTKLKRQPKRVDGPEIGGKADKEAKKRSKEGLKARALKRAKQEN